MLPVATSDDAVDRTAVVGKLSSALVMVGGSREIPGVTSEVLPSKPLVLEAANALLLTLFVLGAEIEVISSKMDDDSRVSLALLVNKVIDEPAEYVVEEVSKLLSVTVKDEV